MAKKQMEIPGAEAPSLPELEKAIEAYREVRDERMAMQVKEAELLVEAKEVARKLVKDGKLKVGRKSDGLQTIYRYIDGDGEQRMVLHGFEEKLRVRKEKSNGSAEAGAED